METLTVDTSIIVKWFARETDSGRARVLLKRYLRGNLRLQTLEIAVVELINALHFGAGMTEGKVKRVVELFYKLDMNLLSVSKGLVGEALIYIGKYQVAAYDALFMAAAEATKTRLVSADRKHHKKQYSQRVVWLDELL